MNRSITTWIIVIALLLIQQLLLKGMGSSDPLPYISILSPEMRPEGHLLLTGIIYLPLSMLFTLNMGRVQDNLRGYGALLVVRNANRGRLLYSELFKMTCSMLIFCGMQCLMSVLLNEINLELTLNTKCIAACGMYMLALHSMLQMQTLAELFLPMGQANLIVQGWLVFSILLGGQVLPNDSGGILGIVLWPNLAFARQNGIWSNGEDGFPFMVYILFFITINICMGFFCRKAICCKDVF
jgi:hypothetical protein